MAQSSSPPLFTSSSPPISPASPTPTAPISSGSATMEPNRRILQADAFPEYLTSPPRSLNPQMEEATHAKNYRWGSVSLPISQQMGSRVYTAVSDNRRGEAVRYPWPTDGRPFQPAPAEATGGDRINTQYDNMLADVLPEKGFDHGDTPFGKKENAWQRILAYHYGLLSPQQLGAARTADEILVAVNDFAAKVHADDPKNACRFLMIEEFKCLQSQQAHMDPQGASTKCVKWFNEWRQCMWDQEKINRGYNYIEDRPPRKRKPYIGTPDWQFS